jgi:cellulose synthase/poly-beta-1,6-N-acetylglucosamine synthase-like glycosyltransferase
MILNAVLGLLFLVLLFWLLACPVTAWIVVHVVSPRRERRICGEPDFPVNLIVPCCGRSAYLEGNLRSFGSQEYRRLRVTFVTRTKQDEASAAIASVARENPRVRHLVAGMSGKRSNKVHSMLTAFQTDRQSSVFLVGDSDLRPAPGWVREMVRPFLDPRVSVTTAHRWIEPRSRGLASSLYTILGGVHCMEIALPFLVQVWGGGFSISRKAYADLGIAELWSTTVSDDVALSNRMAERGVRPFFVPRGVSTSHETPGSLGELMAWYTRWFVTGKFYEFSLWLAGLALETLVCLALAGSLVLLAVEVITGFLEYHALAAPVIIACVAAGPLIMKLTYRWKRDVPAWHWAAVPLVGHFIAAACAWRSVFQGVITWASFTYTVDRDGKVTRKEPAESGTLRGAPAGRR